MKPNDLENIFWSLCETKQELYLWIKLFLKIDLPHTTIDENSNSNSLDFIWKIYYAMKTNTSPNRFVCASSRNCSKTLSISIIAFFGMIHFRRQITVLSAQLNQSNAFIKYLDKYLRIEYCAKYSNLDNKMEKQLIGLPFSPFTDCTESYLLVSVATIKGVNSARASLLIADEVDLISEDILSEFSFIADPTRDNNKFDPVSVYVSSRKSAVGPIQKMIDTYEKNLDNDLQVLKWSVVDWLKHCPDEVCNPNFEETKTEIAYLNQETLMVGWERDGYIPATANNLSKIYAWSGCYKCKIFVVCQSRANNQTCTSPLLRTQKFISSILADARDPAKISAQFLNMKPESVGLIFNIFSRDRHVKNTVQLFQIITNNFTTNITHTLTKKDIYNIAIQYGFQCSWGIDYGFTDDAVLIIILYHKIRRLCIVLHLEYAKGFSNYDWSKYCLGEFAHVYPPDIICPDRADAGCDSYFQNSNFFIKNTKPMRIETGVSQIRSLLFDPIQQKELFFILEDQAGSDRLIEDMTSWTYKKTAMGYDFNRFEDNDYCHSQDALRYSLDTFIIDNNNKIIIHDTPVASQRTNINPQSINEFLKNDFFKENFNIDLNKVFNKHKNDKPNTSTKYPPNKIIIG